MCTAATLTHHTHRLQRRRCRW